MPVLNNSVVYIFLQEWLYNDNKQQTYGAGDSDFLFYCVKKWCWETSPFNIR